MTPAGVARPGLPHRGSKAGNLNSSGRDRKPRTLTSHRRPKLGEQRDRMDKRESLTGHRPGPGLPRPPARHRGGRCRCGSCGLGTPTSQRSRYGRVHRRPWRLARDRRTRPKGRVQVTGNAETISLVATVTTVGEGPLGETPQTTHESQVRTRYRRLRRPPLPLLGSVCPQDPPDTAAAKPGRSRRASCEGIWSRTHTPYRFIPA